MAKQLNIMPSALLWQEGLSLVTSMTRKVISPLWNWSDQHYNTMCSSGIHILKEGVEKLERVQKKSHNNYWMAVENALHLRDLRAQAV